MILRTICISIFTLYAYRTFRPPLLFDALLLFASLGADAGYGDGNNGGGGSKPQLAQPIRSSLLHAEAPRTGSF